MLTKKDFIELGDIVRSINGHYKDNMLTHRLIDLLSEFCKHNNSRFNKDKFSEYCLRERV